MSNFQLVRRRIIDKGALQAPPVAGTLQPVSDLPFCIKAFTQVGIVICDAADQELLAAFADGPVYELDVTFYRLKDVALGSVAGNILFEHSSKVVAHKVNGEFLVNNAVAGAFEPNAFLVNAFVDNVGFANPAITSF